MKLRYPLYNPVTLPYLNSVIREFAKLLNMEIDEPEGNKPNIVKNKSIMHQY